MDEVILSVDGVRHYGWTEVRIIESLDYVAHSFELTLTERWAEQGPSSPRTIRAGMPASIMVNNELLISGYVDEVVPSYNGTSHSIEVIGRSKAGDLVDCSLEGRTFQNQNLLQIAQALAEPFGISVSLDAVVRPPARDAAEVVKPFRTARLEPGQPIYEFLEQLARVRAVRFVSDAQGNLIITRAGASTATTRLALGVNIREARGSMSLRDRFTTYTAIAQQDNEMASAEFNALVSESSADDWGSYHRYRPTTIMVEGAADAAAARQRADWQRRTAYGRSQGLVYTVSGWRQEDGSLWKYNRLVPVQDAWAGISGTRLIVETTRVLDASGQRTELRLMPKEAYELEPLPEPGDADTEWLM